MEHTEAHALTPAYALDALAADEELEAERHLAGCAQCREELPALLEAASALAYGVEAARPPDALRGRVLEQVRAERAKVVPLRSRRLFQATAGLAAAAATIAVLLGGWALRLSDSLDETRSALSGQADAAAILAAPGARQVPLRGGQGQLVVLASGEAALVVSGLRPAPSSRVYAIWVQERDTPRLAGRFRAERGRDLVALERAVPPGASVLVTLEPDDGGDKPTAKPFISAKA